MTHYLDGEEIEPGFKKPKGWIDQAYGVEHKPHKEVEPTGDEDKQVNELEK